MLSAAGGEHTGPPPRGSRAISAIRPCRESRAEGGSSAPGVRHGDRGPAGALRLSRLLTLGWVPIQASSGTHECAPPPLLLTPPGPRPLQPATGSESPHSSMLAGAARRWCTATYARPEAGARASPFRFLAARCLRARGLDNAGRIKCAAPCGRPSRNLCQRTLVSLCAC